MISVKHLCHMVITCGLLSFQIAEAMEPRFESQTGLAAGLYDLDASAPGCLSNYKFGHAYTLTPQDLQVLTAKGRQKLSEILAGRPEADQHELAVFKDYNKHNIYYFKNGLTLTNLCSWISGAFTANAEDSLYLPLQARVETFVSIVWALVELSWQQGDKFNRGAIIIEDKDRRLHDYLENLTVYCAGVTKSEELSDGVYNLWGSNIGYSRMAKSSHFVGRQLTHYGFDARFEPESFALPVLPFGMTHVLFGRVLNHAGQEVTFLKPEEAGMADLRSLFYHTYCLFAPIPESKILRREKDVPRLLAREAMELIRLIEINRDNLDGLKNDESLWAAVDKMKSEQFNRLLLETTHHYDIAWIVALLARLDAVSNLSEELVGQSTYLKEKLCKWFQLDSLFLRSGCEVLFLDEELKTKLTPQEVSIVNA
ncbi:hypothetical protein [Candidatus Odyssella thessalonicensis]|uniref:hypothetical protein n=1 Tax=Candidatus Odyssella thessalonicensis TaxID=84647 RepID=UPI000225C1AA|nr:hypothetical protein [Candidatus Odyssella thessalonicensis]